MAAKTTMADATNRNPVPALALIASKAYGFLTTLGRIGVKVGRAAHNFLYTAQVARMISTLSRLSDNQLAQIGISRSDIPKYAETLMATDQKASDSAKD
tara:strand:- start:332 stop:628 length:297 start_codon:yes stop_codon:yes gene_type:complete